MVSLIPVVGTVISGTEAIIAARIAIKAFEEGDFDEAEKAVIEFMTSSAGLIPGGKILSRGARPLIRKAARELLERIRLRRPSRIIGRNLSRKDVATKFGIDHESPFLDLLLEHREGTVREFISGTRAGRIKQEFPGKFLDMNLFDAIASDNRIVHKLLKNRRFKK